MEIGDGPAAVTGNERRSVSLMKRSGRRGVRVIRESEDLPETMCLSPRIRETATRRGFTRASPDHIYGPGFFLPRLRPAQGSRHRDGPPCHDITASEERIRSLVTEFPPGRRTRTPARSGSLCGTTVCRRWAAAVPPFGRRRFRLLIRRNCRMRSSSPSVRKLRLTQAALPGQRRFLCSSFFPLFIPMACQQPPVAKAHTLGTAFCPFRETWQGLCRPESAWATTGKGACRPA